MLLMMVNVVRMMMMMMMVIVMEPQGLILSSVIETNRIK